MAENRSKSDQYLLRLPPGLRGKLQKAADTNARSLNAEIVDCLERSLDAPYEEREAAREIERLKNSLAYEQGRNSSFAQSMRVFVKYLVKASNGEPISFTEIQSELEEPTEKKDILAEVAAAKSKPVVLKRKAKNKQ
jgi:hypothetical protein